MCISLVDAKTKQSLREQQGFLTPLLVTAKESKFCKFKLLNTTEGIYLLLIVLTYKRIQGLIRNKDQEMN